MNHERTFHERVQNIQSFSFFDETAQSPYPVDRGLIDRFVIGFPREILDGYPRYLPTFENEDITSVIEKKIDKQGEVRMLDVGCGSGRFLLDCKQRWGDKIYPVGISAFPYHKNIPRNYQVMGLPLVPTERELEQSGIPVIVGAAHDLKKILKENRNDQNFDVVVSVMALGYMDNPLLILKSLYDVLSPGGVGFVQHFNPLYSMSERTFNFLKNNYRRSTILRSEMILLLLRKSINTFHCLSLFG